MPIRQDDPEITNISSFTEYRYRKHIIVGCSRSGLDEIRKLEWHTNPIPDALRVRRMDRGNWIRYALKNESDEIQERELTFFSTNISRIEFCSVDAEGKYENSEYIGAESSDFQSVFRPSFPRFSIRLQPRESRTFYYFFSSMEDITYANFPVKLLTRSATQRLAEFWFTTQIYILTGSLIATLLSLVYWYKRKNPVFLVLVLQVFLSFASFYFLQVKPFSFFIGGSGRLLGFPYFLFQATTYAAFFLFLNFVERIWDSDREPKISFLGASLVGLPYLLIPLSQPVFDYRILILVATTSLAIYYFLKSHRTLFGSSRIPILVYWISWAIFLVFNLGKALYHFDFYPYNEFSVFASVLYAPFHFVLIGGCLFRMSSTEFFSKDLPKPSSRKSTVSSLEVDRLVSRIRALIEEERIFLKNSLKEEHLAKELGIGVHQLSEIINVEFKTSFPSLLNYYRIEEAKKLLGLSPKLTVTEVRVKSGFSSKSAFNLEFKKLTGLSPNGYRRAHIAERLRDPS
ncbi:helix-turn-helix domain-containing protein [Leptospira fluminis]|uniref:helix-turn-helix domain-containing protein n=1 Tax=Leptospira fluminis TaxID=2484979 RepID=UPI001FE8F8BB|nr:helix-turn-helix domain-containing protein [Leptospira fluminis]